MYQPISSMKVQHAYMAQFGYLVLESYPRVLSFVGFLLYNSKILVQTEQLSQIESELCIDFESGRPGWVRCRMPNGSL